MTVEAVRVLLEAVRMLLEAVRMIIGAVRKIIETVRLFVRQNNALIGSSMERALSLCAPGYLILITAKIFPSYLTLRSATIKSSATSQRAIKFSGSERHV